MKRRFSNPEEAFQARTSPRGDCLVWTGGKTRAGYGRVRVEGREVYAHRYAWERVNGPIPEGMLIDHTCWAPACVNVDHLRLATVAQNCRNLPGASAANNTTGVRNVYPHGSGYMVRVGYAGGSVYGGIHPNIADAEKVAARLRAELFGEFAGLGFAQYTKGAS